MVDSAGWVLAGLLVMKGFFRQWKSRIKAMDTVFGSWWAEQLVGGV